MTSSTRWVLILLTAALSGAVQGFSPAGQNAKFRSVMTTTTTTGSSSSSILNNNNGNNAPKTRLHVTHVVREPEEVVEAGTSVVRRELAVARHPDPLSQIDFDTPKSRERLSLSRLAQRLDQELYEKEWFVTGHVNPKYFHSDFSYQDADVEIFSLEEYARDVYNLFDQSCSRAEVLETKVAQDRAQTITCTWRCSGRANLLWGIDIKPFMVTTNWQVDKATGLIYRQVDEYSLPQWDLLVSAFFPFLNGILTAEPAPPVPPRRRPSPAAAAAATVPRSPFLAWAAKSGFETYFSRPKRQQPDTGSPLDDFVEFLAEDKNHFFDWMPPVIGHNNGGGLVGVDEKKLVTPDHLPTIKAPTLWDRMQAYAPNDATLLENLTEATRRTESRRSRRYYVAWEDPKAAKNTQGEPIATALKEEGKEEAVADPVLSP
uniref:Uncharacterized protein n=1 Tax=Amphora coffeiformis TaxID=265554 RepID=A0A7S3P9H3_9STRA